MKDPNKIAERGWLPLSRFTQLGGYGGLEHRHYYRSSIQYLLRKNHDPKRTKGLAFYSYSLPPE